MGAGVPRGQGISVSVKADAETNVFLFSGNDEFRIAVAARECVRERTGENPDAFALDVIQEGDQADALEALTQFVRSALTPPFLGGRKTVWLKDFSGFTGEKKTGPLAAPFQRLCEVIEAGVPRDLVLVMSGPGADPDKRLGKACAAAGRVALFTRPDIRVRGWQDQVARLISERAAAKGIALDADARGRLVEVVGGDVPRIDGELDKLACYVGDPPRVITPGDVAAVCPGEAETVSWALQDAVAERNVGHALRLLDNQLRCVTEPDKALRTAARQTAELVRQMLQLKLYMSAAGLDTPERVRRAITGMKAAEQTNWCDQGLEVVTVKPFRGVRLAEGANRFSGRELVAALIALRDVDWLCVTNTSMSRTAFERVLVGLCGRPRGAGPRTVPVSARSG